MRFALILFLSYSIVQSQWIKSKEYDEIVQKGIAFTYNLEYKKAEEEFNKIILKYPDHPSGYFFIAMIDWCKILVEIDNENRDEIFIEKLDVVIDKCDKILDKNKNDVSALFFKGGSLGFRGRLRANREKWILAANDGRLALPIVQSAFKLEPKNYDVLLGIGIYDYFAELIPEKYPIVKPIMEFFPKGNKKKGISELETASKKSKYASVEASYFLMQLNYSYEKNYLKALNIANELTHKFPNNSVFMRYLGRINISLGNLHDSKIVFEKILENCNKNKNGYFSIAKREALYYLGLINFFNSDFNESLKYFYLCDELSRSIDNDGASAFMVLTNLKIGFIYDMQKKRNLAKSQYNKILNMKEFDNSHDVARKYLKENYR